MAIEATTQPLLVVLLLLWLERVARLETYGVAQGVVAGSARRPHHVLLHGQPAARPAARGRARRLRRPWALAIRRRRLGERSWSPSFRSASMRSDTLATSPRATRRRRSRGTASRLRGSCCRRSGTGSGTSTRGTGRPAEIRPRTSTTAATARCSAPSSFSPWPGQCSSSSGDARKPVVALRPARDAPRSDSGRSHRRSSQRDPARDASGLRARPRRSGGGRARWRGQDVVARAAGAAAVLALSVVVAVRPVPRQLPDSRPGAARAVRRWRRSLSSRSRSRRARRSTSTSTTAAPRRRRAGAWRRPACLRVAS